MRAPSAPPTCLPHRQVPETTLQEILPKVLKPDMNSVLGSPEHLELFLLAQQKVPKKLEKLMGPVNLFSDENIPRCEGGGQVGPPSTGLHRDPGVGVHVAPGAWPLLAGDCPLSLLHPHPPPTSAGW